MLIILNWMFVNTLITRHSETWWYLSGFSDFARLIIGTYTQPSKWNSTSWNSFYGEVTHIVNGNQAFYKFLWHFSVFNLRGSKCTYLRITECPLVFAHLITFDFNLQENWHYNIQHHLVMGPALPCGPVLWRGPISKSCFKTFFLIFLLFCAHIFLNNNKLTHRKTRGQGLGCLVGRWQK